MVLLSDGIIHAVNNFGRTLRVRYYTEGIGSVWDDERTLTASGTDLYISGVFMTLDTAKGSSDELLIEQGRIRYGDSKAFINGSILTTSGTKVFTMSLSGANVVYREINPGVNLPQFLGVDIMKKIYLRELQTGSLF